MTDGRVSSIVEQKDCTAEEAAVQEINTGTYSFDNQKMFKALLRLRMIMRRMNIT